jgi:hypothetical protein
MELLRHGARVGDLVRYFYETPWASAWLTPDNPEDVRRLVAAAAFLAWVEAAPDDLADAEYDAQLARRGLDQSLVDGFHAGWAVRVDGALREVALADVDADGWVRWRW